ncbi:hypothetical protein [Streptomyces sp. NBC_01497]|uniref:hypothetical protein n=1 Tax=Streptomyces sp. NBC_01497 TaxID=2903885 RepID=UPI002E35680C|nr:hypothetical protein [Streptomyces sp. NBC_01497]
MALFARNSPEAVLLQLAAHFVGCRLVFVPLSPGGGLEALVRRADVEALLFDAALGDRALPVAGSAGVPLVLSIGTCPGAVDFLATASGHGRLAPHEAADSCHVATLLCTGSVPAAPRASPSWSSTDAPPPRTWRGTRAA